MARVRIDVAAIRVVLAAALLVATILTAIAVVIWTGARLDQSERDAVSSAVVNGTAVLRSSR